ncbi:5694fe39-0694-4ebe-97de-e74882fc229a [Thermothielavioides terrestris]|uniref:5694fe39-0694-4ebe-97de-e74882fc229a n=1 Tax=Thermothielavioides terrestris TaxID=2587410 RepID=A0A446BS42_9PEZI|nr:5694fe39-0694-4ebe-97de-e74882fc229a [Thermothielavioides terrestris]
MEPTYLGFKWLYRPPATQAPTVDFVAIHGFFGDLEKSWEKPNDNGQNNLLKNLLAKDFPTARIGSWGYSSLGKFDSCEDVIQTLAAAFLNDCCADLMHDEPIPIVFLCSEFGGIIAKKALMLAFSDPILSKKWEALRSSVRGLVFFGTPQTIAGDVRELLYLLLVERDLASRPELWGDTHLRGFYGEAPHCLHAGRVLKALSDEFQVFMQSHRLIAILSFYDTHPIKRSWELTTSTLGKKAVELGVPGEETCMLPSDFLNLVRHESPSSSSYVIVRAKMKTLVQGVREEWNASNGFGKATGLPFRQAEVPGAMHDSESGARRRLPDPASGNYWITVNMHPIIDFVAERRTNQRPIRVAVLDSGVDGTHPELEPRIKNGQIRCASFVDGHPGDVDSCGHGTHLAHLLLQVAPRVEVYSARVFLKDDVEEAERNVELIAQAIETAAGKDKKAGHWAVDIICMSWGFPRQHKAIKDAIRKAHFHGCILFAAASNSGFWNPTSFPASMREVICVNSCDADGRPSNFNPPAILGDNFMILGEHLVAAWPVALSEEGSPTNRLMKSLSGTSQSVPVAAGLAALVLEYSRQAGGKATSVPNWQELGHGNEMRKVFEVMSKTVGQYKLLVPELLFDLRGKNSKEQHTHVCRMITDALDKL